MKIKFLFETEVTFSRKNADRKTKKWIYDGEILEIKSYSSLKNRVITKKGEIIHSFSLIIPFVEFSN